MCLDIALFDELGRELHRLVVVVLLVLLSAGINTVQRWALVKTHDGGRDPLKQVGCASLVLLDETIEFAAGGKHI